MSRLLDPIDSPTVRKWTRTLRSRSPSPTRSADFGGQVPQVSSARSARKTDMASLLRRSTGNLGSTSLSTSGKVIKSTTALPDNIEAEYIKNLQQQIYFLELEANYLRDQARKASDLHPRMQLEADKMLTKLQVMEKEVTLLREEIRVKETEIEAAQNQNQALLSRMRDEEDTHKRERTSITETLITLKKEKDRLERDLLRKESQLHEARTQLDQSVEALQSAEARIKNYKFQLQQRTEEQAALQLMLEEKRGEVTRLEARLMEAESKASSSNLHHEQISAGLKTEIQSLRQRVRELELQTEKDGVVKGKMSEDSDKLIRENAELMQRVQDVQSKLSREQQLRESVEHRQSSQISEMVSLRNQESALRIELEQLRDQLRSESDKVKSYLEELSKMTSKYNASEVQLRSKAGQLADLQARFEELDSENSQLRKDKSLLVDHVSDIQSKLEQREEDMRRLQTVVSALESKLREYQLEQDLEHSKQSQKWEEFSRLAESMRTLSRSMAAHTASGLGTTTTKTSTTTVQRVLLEN